jgi:hypothetical protein
MGATPTLGPPSDSSESGACRGGRRVAELALLERVTRARGGLAVSADTDPLDGYLDGFRDQPAAGWLLSSLMPAQLLLVDETDGGAIQYLGREAPLAIGLPVLDRDHLGVVELSLIDDQGNLEQSGVRRRAAVLVDPERSIRDPYPAKEDRVASVISGAKPSVDTQNRPLIDT